MVDEWLTALQGLELARALHDSVWAYPLVNAGHVLGIALLVGSVIPLDLRLLGVWQSVALLPLWRVLTTVAGVGLAVAIVCGALLFITRATEYAASEFFLAKMIVVTFGIINAAALSFVVPRCSVLGENPPQRFPRRIRVAAGISLAAWLAALILGRLGGYF